MKPVIIAVAGGSASGKTTVVNEILSKLDLTSVAIIKHDDYYKDQEDMSLEERYKVNYDHPDSLDNDLLVKHIQMLLEGKSVLKPVYDFEQYTRSKNTETVEPRKVIILEGILILTDERIRNLSSIKLFVELDEDTRFIRRLQRDLKERGRSVDSVIAQYQSTVKPMHHKYVKPTKRYADVIIPNDYNHDVAVDIIVSKIKMILEEHK
ncbi:uridine kinase [Acholeplasma morum]|uniref:uridine kinase n=1 Tax=Paracholeplasma morum TaxID=264637 RepID=UPI001956B864|nr:uridine kinase [Paracholeplasma morum]MBM7453941.1 uridine kinase [Paracholeplasma morum]